VATSTIPAAIDALLAACRAAPSLAAVAVHDGPEVAPYSTKADLFIGWAPNTDSVDGEQSFAHIGARVRDERFEIECYATAWTGNSSTAAGAQKTVRDSAFAILGAVEVLLRGGVGDPSITGSVMYAQITRLAVAQDQTKRGARCAVTFTIAARARI
jgi:hypothetical protein